MASTFRAHFVRNFAAITYSFLLRFLDFVRLSFAPSSSVRDSFFHSLRTSSIFGLRKDRVERNAAGLKEGGGSVSLKTTKKYNQLALLITVLAEGERYHSKEDNGGSIRPRYCIFNSVMNNEGIFLISSIL